MKIIDETLSLEYGDQFPVDAIRVKGYGVKSPIKDSGIRKITDTIVLHYTASSSLSGAISTLYNNKTSKVSAHIVIDRSGKIHQLMPLNKRAWHAGESSYQGRTYLNQYSIGIEIENKGELEKGEDSQFYTWYKKIVPPAHVFQKRFGKDSETSYWHTYTPEQIESVIELCHLLCKSYDIKYILGHHEIAPTRKRDPGAAFPLEKVRNIMFEKRDDSPISDNQHHTNDLQVGNIGLVTANKLNIREEGKIGSEKIAKPLHKNQTVTIVDEKPGWYKVETTIIGWVSSDYISKK